jgi:DNA-binding CsgD family transcriptional regulator
VFAGRFTLADVEPVCCSDGVPAARALDLLSSLIDKSLVIKEDIAGAAACYRLHETMREYARLKLYEAGEEDATERRCADYYLSRCARFAAEGRYRLIEWLAWMELEIDNIRAVLRRCLDHEDYRRGIDLATCLIWYWITRATTEGVRWLDDRVAQCHLLGGLGCCAAGSRQPRLAAQLLGAMENLRAEAGASINAGMAPVLAQARTSVTATLGQSKFKMEFKAGQELSRDAAARLALGEADPPAAAASDHGSAGVLRQRETDVARLVAEGLSNKEIGARLFISERTVESHVRNIMNKLGFNTRAQIAGWIEPRVPDLPVDDARRDGGEVSRRAAEQVPAAVCALQVAMSLVLPGDTDGAVQLDHLARGLGQCL